MTFTPNTLRGILATLYPDNAAGEISPADIRQGFNVTADVIEQVLPDFSAMASAAEAAASALESAGYRDEAQTLRDEAETFRADAAAFAAAAAASAAAADVTRGANNHFTGSNTFDGNDVHNGDDHFTGDLTLDGSNHFTGTNQFSDDLRIDSDDSIFMGGADDVEMLYSSSGNKWIARAKTALTTLSMRFSVFEIVNFDNTKSFLRGVLNAQIELFFNGSKRLETDTSGVIVTGRVRETARDTERWHSVTRTAGTWYQNTTGRAIKVIAMPESSLSPGAIILHINDTPANNTVGYHTTPGNGIGWRGQLYGEVPAGHYYKIEVTNGASIFSVLELS